MYYMDDTPCRGRTKIASQEVQRKLYIMLNLSTPIYFYEKSIDQSRWKKRDYINLAIKLYGDVCLLILLCADLRLVHIFNLVRVRILVRIIECCEVCGAVKSAADTLQVIWLASTHTDRTALSQSSNSMQKRKYRI